MLGLYSWGVPGQPQCLSTTVTSCLGSEGKRVALTTTAFKFSAFPLPWDQDFLEDSRTSLKAIASNQLMSHACWCLWRSCQLKDIIPFFQRGTLLVDQEVGACSCLLRLWVLHPLHSPALLFTALLSPHPQALVSGGLSIPNPCFIMKSQKCPLQCSSLMPVCKRMMFNT